MSSFRRAGFRGDLIYSDAHHHDEFGHGRSEGDKIVEGDFSVVDR